MTSDNLTTEERAILSALSDAWNIFCTLDKQSELDNIEFAQAIHAAQAKIALRVARRIDPTLWSQPK